MTILLSLVCAIKFDDTITLGARAVSAYPWKLGIMIRVWQITVSLDQMILSTTGHVFRKNRNHQPARSQFL